MGCLWGDQAWGRSGEPGQGCPLYFQAVHSVALVTNEHPWWAAEMPSVRGDPEKSSTDTVKGTAKSPSLINGAKSTTPIHLECTSPLLRPGPPEGRGEREGGAASEGLRFSRHTMRLQAALFMSQLSLLPKRLMWVLPPGAGGWVHCTLFGDNCDLGLPVVRCRCDHQGQLPWEVCANGLSLNRPALTWRPRVVS